MIAQVVRSVVAAVALALALLLAGCTSSGEDRIRHFDIHYTIESSGLVHVVETIDYEFGGSEDHHGIDRFLASRFGTDTPGTDRVYRYANITVESPTGASTLYSTALGNALQIRIGNKNALVSGVQTYVLRYDIEGALNRAIQGEGSPAAGSALDEFAWNATGSFWNPAIERTTVRVTGPTAAVSARCFAGIDGTQDACAESRLHNNDALFSHGRIESRQGMTIVATWPEGTFTAVEPVLEPSLPAGLEPVRSGSNDGPDPFWNPWHWGSALALVAGVPLAFRLVVAGRRRDRRFAGVTPGSIPNDPAARTENAPRDELIVVQYQPPRGLPVGAARAVLEKKRVNADVTVTLVDLAVRGYLRIEEVASAKARGTSDWVLIATPSRALEKKQRARPGSPDAAELLPFEALLLEKLFAREGARVTLSELSTTFSSDLRAILKALDAHLDQRDFFLDKLNGTPRVLSLGMGAGLLGFIAATMFNGPVLVPVGLAVGSFLGMRSANSAVRRTALGHALYLQVAGFREYIATAEADRIRFEEGEDVFSRYLPWAMVFGEAERWAKVFAELVDQGKVEAGSVQASTADWYVSGSMFSASSLNDSISSIASIGSAVDSFTSSATQSFAATASSSGDSGGGGGGGGGSGGGGGGGGSW